MTFLMNIVVALVLVVPAWAQDKVATARAAFDRGNFEEAAVAIGEPESAEERYWLGRSLLELQRPDEAEARFRQMIESEGESAAAFEGIARVFVSKKNYGEAVANANKAVQLDPQRASAHYVLGLANIYRQDFNAAGPSLEKSLALDPSNGYAYYQLGMVQYRLKRYDMTVRNFQKFVDMMPNAPEAAQVRSILNTIR